MATIARRPCIPAKTLHGGPPFQVWFPEAASQTFVKGEAVYLDGSGHVAEYTTALDDGTQRFLGFAAEDGHNDASAATHDVGVYLPTGTIFEANVTGSAGADQVTAITQPGTLLPMYLDATNNIVLVDISDTGSNGDWVRIFGLSEKDVAGDTNGRVLFTIVPAALQISGT